MILLTEDDARPGRDDWPRKSGRIIVEHDGQRIECYSPSSLPSYLGGGFSAPAWSARCQAKGAGLRPDLAVMAAPLDVSADRDELDRLVAEMEVAGGRMAAANRGTAMHSAIRRLLRGIEPEMPEGCEADLAAIRVELDAWGIELVEGMDEVQLFSPHLPACGQADAIVRCERLDGRPIVLDHKTGSLRPLDCAIQLAPYAQSTHLASLGGDGAVQLEALPFELGTDVGLVLHAPWGKGTARIVPVDLVEGWRLAHLAVAAHRETLDSGRVVIKDLGSRVPFRTVEPSSEAPGPVPASPPVPAPRTPTLTSRIGDLRRRLGRIVEQGAATRPEIVALMTEAGLPPLTDIDAQTDDSVDNWEGIVMVLEMALAPEDLADRIADTLARLRALPVDLLAHAELRAKELDPPVPNLESGKATALDLDRLDEVLAPIEMAHAERVAVVTRHLAEFDEVEADGIVIWATDQRDDYESSTTDVHSLDNLEADRVIALCATYAADDLVEALKATATPKQLLDIARPLAEAHELPRPRSGRDIASDRLLAGLVLTHNTNTESSN